ncbi:MAG: undecaprenyl-phosphate glucose phosphotransferase [Sphaerochaeta sp.]|jgi:exopolysaccharide biosynthesis polyprenyl glycosylphosphotransferase|nr:undecaprenyl-phosphate glucose phosphotransferase [Spirochaetales bacterium]
MKHGKRSLLVLKVTVDIVAVLTSWLLAGYLRFYVIPGAGTFNSFILFVQLAIVVLGFNLFFISRNGLYTEDLEHSWRKETTKIVFSTFEAFLLLVVMLYFLFLGKITRIAIGLHLIFSVILLVTGRTLVSNHIKRGYVRGRYTRRILLVGFGENLANFERDLHSDAVKGIQVVGHFDGEGKAIGKVKEIEGENLRQVVDALSPDMVVLGYPPSEETRQRLMIGQAVDLLNERVVLLPNLPESYIGTKISDFRWTPLLTLNAADMGVFQRMIKRTFDFVASLLALILLSPILALVALIIKISSPGPVVFKQQRITRDGEEFTMYKFRSMRTDMPEGDTARWTVEDDPRVTAIGKFIRKTSIDELPQLFNVLGGSMSLVGPRPERPELVEQFSTTIPGYQLRHRFKAGISGWAQVNGWRGNTSLERRIEFDLFYIRNWSFLFDLKIVLFTFFKGFVNENAY